ncbi:hypothetical protein NC796_03395 [Aliifodinibius sp. S!AR15-10]|uniref:hypothetical protein n=1 Tax=Aliifodinibius sp. S!AR15-10 TaxID=2950437 RepID=UPI00285F4EF5|nr:hypothetical protein [Aliifodinibius sp. S!AR15-10]MDR8390171.1 hypothetical protein [Aliifodinibius sp. S!AR15-10]
MKGVLVLIIVALLPTTLLAQNYEVKKRCKGNGTNAMVVEHKDQYFVVKTPRYFQHGWMIRRLVGINGGGYRTLDYLNSSGDSYQMEVQVLSRMQWNYSGYAAARTVCRKITQAGYRDI